MNNKMMMILMGVVCVVLIGFGTMMFVMWSKISALDPSAKHKGGEKSADKSETIQLGPMFPLEAFIVNLDDPKLRKYLRVTMDLELKTKEDVKEVEDRLPQIRDYILTILPAKQFDQVSTIEGKNLLRREIQKAINGFFKKEIIVNIYFTEFVIQ
jgi:flagellar protein FliL